MSLCDQSRQTRAVVPRRLPRALGQDQLPLHIDHDQPFQPVFPASLLLAEMLHPADEVTADRALRQTGCIHGYRGATSPPPGHPAHSFVHNPGHVVHIQASEEAVQRGVVRNRLQPQGAPQLNVFAEPHLGFAKGPVLVAHQAEHSQQLRLREGPLAELRSLRRQDCLADLQSQAGKAHQSHFSHSQSADTPEQPQVSPISATLPARVPRMSTEPKQFKTSRSRSLSTVSASPWQSPGCCIQCGPWWP